MMQWNRVVTAGLSLVFLMSSAALAKGRSRTLLEMKDGEPQAALAKSWKKVEKGRYRFELDPKKKLRRGKDVTPKAVKGSLERKLGRVLSVKVKADGEHAVVVSYKGDEEKFLEKVARTRIRAGRNVELALDSSASDGGIRAKTADRPPKKSEVKAVVVANAGDNVLAKVRASKNDKVKKGEVVKVKHSGAKIKLNQKIFFVPKKQKGGVWIPKKGTLK